MTEPGVVVWFTGRPSSGKSTLARAVESTLHERGQHVIVLDGDEVREVLVPRPGYDAESRDAYYATLAGLAALLAKQGAIVLVPATAHLRALRERARKLAPNFLEIYVATSAEECRARDSKGLYAGAVAGRVHDLPGADSAYEPPLAPELTVERGGRDPAAAAAVCALIEQTAHILR